MLATRISSSTVDTPQSASKAIYHSYPSESLAGRSPSWLSEGGWAGSGGGKMEADSVSPLEGSPPARLRRAADEAAGSDESLLSEETAAEVAWPRSTTADGGRARRKKWPPEAGGR